VETQPPSCHAPNSKGQERFCRAGGATANHIHALRKASNLGISSSRYDNLTQTLGRLKGQGEDYSCYDSPNS